MCGRLWKVSCCLLVHCLISISIFENKWNGFELRKLTWLWLLLLLLLLCCCCCCFVITNIQIANHNAKQAHLNTSEENSHRIHGMNVCTLQWNAHIRASMLITLQLAGIKSSDAWCYEAMNIACMASNVYVLNPHTYGWISNCLIKIVVQYKWSGCFSFSRFCCIVKWVKIGEMRE